MSARPATKRASLPSNAAGTPLPVRGRALVLVGVLLAVFGTAISMIPGGYNPFGPAKAFVLMCAIASIAAGLALSPELALAFARRARSTRGVWAGAALLGVAALATVMSIAPEQSLVGHYPEYQGLLLLLAAGLVGLGAFSLADDESAWEVLGHVATLAVLAVFAYALLQFINIDPVVYQREFLVRRVRSTLGNASNLGVFICLALPLVVAHARAERGAWRWLAWASAGAGAVTLAWSLSRGAWLGALVGVAVWLVAEGRSWRPQTRLRAAGVAAIVALVVAAAIVLSVPSAGARLVSLVDPTTGTAGWRVEVWAATARLVAERPVLGFGPATFRYAFPPRRTASMMAGETGTQTLDDPHNLFASAAVCAGLAGLLALVWLLAEGFVAAWSLGADARRPHESAALLASLAAGVVALQFHFVTLDSAPLLALVLGLAIGRDAQLRAAGKGAARTTDEHAHVRQRYRLARVVATSIAALALAGCVAAGLLVLADRDVASGFSTVADKAPWTQARSNFSAAKRLAGWEPAIVWAMGRAATQWISATGQVDSFDDGRAAMSETATRLPLDGLAAAQRAELYLVYGLAAKDRPALEQALSLAEHANAMDPENGYRWEAKGTALAALGETQGALDALTRAVAFAPGDAQAWGNLARIYGRLGQTAQQQNAQTHADALKAHGTP